MSSRQWSLAVAPGTSGFGVLNARTRAETASYPFAGGVTGPPPESPAANGSRGRGAGGSGGWGGACVSLSWLCSPRGLDTQGRIDGATRDSLGSQACTLAKEEKGL